MKGSRSWLANLLIQPVTAGLLGRSKASCVPRQAAHRICLYEVCSFLLVSDTANWNALTEFLPAGSGRDVLPCGSGFICASRLS